MAEQWVISSTDTRVIGFPSIQVWHNAGHSTQIHTTPSGRIHLPAGQRWVVTPTPPTDLPDALAEAITGLGERDLRAVVAFAQFIANRAVVP